MQRKLALATLSLTLACLANGANITGRILNLDREPVAGLLVTAVQLETRFGGVARSDEKGEFAITDMPAGRFSVDGSGHGYQVQPAHVVIEANDVHVSLTAVRMMGAVPPVPPDPNTIGPENYTTYTIFYGTDRKARSSNPAAYGADRGELALGTCQVSIPRDHRLGKLELPFWKRMFLPEIEKRVTLLGTTELDAAQFRARLAQALGETPSVLVFVHGFNVSFEEAALRTAQLSYDLAGHKVVPSFYSWPSNGEMLAYAADGEQAQRAVRYLVRYLRTIASNPGAEKIHVIAHSMGNRVLTAALREFQQETADGRPSKIGQVALVAPDVDAEIFREDIAPRIAGLGTRITLYASDSDKALLLSKKLHKFPRAGDIADGVVIVPGVDTIDVSAVDTSFLGHSYFADNRSVIADIYALLTVNAAPAARFGMRTLQSQGLTYWAFRP